MKIESQETQPARVSRHFGAKQVGAVRARWAWTEPAVWTDRMLTALEQGVKGGVWFSLIDKVYSTSNLRAAFAKVKANGGAAGCDHQTIAMYGSRLEANLKELSEQLRTGAYRPRKVRRVYIPKAGSRERRPLGIPSVRDRVVQTALRNVLEPIFERDFAEHSYGFRSGRGCKDALRRVDALLKAGYTYVVDVDLRNYFDTIPHEPLMDRVAAKVADGRVLTLIESFLTQRVMDGLEEWTPTSGSPQGAVISPLLSNAYLDPLDHLMARKGMAMVRYADDSAPRTHADWACGAALEMGAGPSESTCRSRFQTTLSGGGQEPRVVSVMGKGTTRSCQVRIKETSASEPLKTRRKRRDDVKTGRQSLTQDQPERNLLTARVASGVKVA